MTRAGRLLQLMAVLRRHRTPVSGRSLAAELGISLRTLYRDVATLQSEGVHLDGAPGLGYLLRPGSLLPPLAFTEAELEALVLGSRWVAARGDPPLRAAAVDALSKIAAVVPTVSRHELDTSGLLVGPPERSGGSDDACLADIRRAIRRETRLVIDYRDAAGAETRRTIWPLAIGYFDRVRVVVAWCEHRSDLRHFRSDRIRATEPTELRYPRRRHLLLREWRVREGLEPGPAAEAPSQTADGN